MLVTAPAIRHAGSHFLAGGAAGHGEAAPGDHLQTAYRLWLVGHQLENGRVPWRDPYSFRPESDWRLNPGGWPFGLPYWPLWRALGQVLAWNVFVLLTFVAAGALACAWLRELGLPRGPSLAGGLVFAMAPYRAAQSVGHLLGPISIMLPLSLWALERSRRGSRWWLALAGAALATIPLSGQVHLALGAIPLFLAYAAVRTRERWRLAGVGACVAVAVGAGLAVRYGVIAGSIEADGRSLGEVAAFSAEWADFVVRHKRHGSESFVFLGWLTPVAALAGLALLAWRRRYGLATVLGLAAVLPALLALGTNLPLYRAVRFLVPPFRYTRVPERLMPIACLAIAALVAFALHELLRLDLSRLRLARRPALAVAAVAIALLAADLRVEIFGASAADGGNRAYAAIRSQPPGRVLELPVFLPDTHFGSVYLYYTTQARRERPTGYSTTAPVAADELARRLRPLNCGEWPEGTGALLRRLGVTVYAFHLGLFTENPAVPGRAWFAWRSLMRHGFRPLARDGAVVALTRRGSGPPVRPPVPEPARNLLQFCSGWYANDGRGRQMADGHAPFWAYGSGDLRLFVSAPRPLTVRVTVDGREIARERVSSLREVRVPLGRERGWRLIALEARLPRIGGRPRGARLLGYALS